MSCRTPRGQDKEQQRNLLYIGLYRLIWGEAANLRFLPECLCYIFHHMASEVNTFLDGYPGLVTIKPLFSGVDDNAFLEKVITPVYKVIEKESNRNKNGKAPHSAWCNYDDLNEYFWKLDCFALGWPMLEDVDFFNSTRDNGGSLGKSFFVESRSFWHTFRSFDRMWAFLILALQIMVMIAWSDVSVSEVFEKQRLYKISIIFVTSSCLRLFQSVLDIVLNFPGYHHKWNFTDVVRNIMKVLTCLVCFFGLLVAYRKPRIYCVAVAVYFLPNLVSAVLVVFPRLQSQIEENSSNRIIQSFMWWSQPRTYVGRGMHESLISVIKYTVFWVVLLCAKFAFSFLFEIRPLVEATKTIMNIKPVEHDWHDIFPDDKSNYGAVAALWPPMILMYFMDTQIWYTIFSTLYGGMIGVIDRLGEIRTLEMLRSRFQSVPGAFNAYLLPSERSKKTGSFMSKQYAEVANCRLLWNEVVSSFREEDLITHRELDLLLFPHPTDPRLNLIQWPLFLLAGKVRIALDKALDFRSKDDNDLWKYICADEYVKLAVIECYESLKLVLDDLVVGEAEKRIIDTVFNQVDGNISNKMFLSNLRTGSLPTLHNQFEKLVECLIKDDASKKNTVVLLLREILEVATHDLKINEICELKDLVHGSKDSGTQLFKKDSAIVLPTPEQVMQIKRLYLLLTTDDSDMDVPKNLEAQRRITFFTNSLFMNMPRAPRVREMLPFSVMTPYYSEETIYSRGDIDMETEDGISIIYYLQKIFPDEWENFKERLNVSHDSEVFQSDQSLLDLRHWVSLRGQTLYRTVRGMMYYRRALKLQAFIDIATDIDYKAALNPSEKEKKSQKSLYARLEALVDLKFTYVATCQNYGNQKRSGDRRATDILDMMVKNPSLRVAYIDELEIRQGGESQKVYFSVLTKAVENTEQEIYRIQLPGSAKIGEGKPENQNHAIIFTRGEALQTIDMNQDNYLEEAFKMRNLLEEFNGVRSPTILGVREHIFTESLSSLAWFMSNQETSFVTIGQRVLARPLKVRFHYGHPDVFDRIFHITRGGISKASKGINLTEDIFAGFNSTLRGGNITHHEYIQVGKGRDVGLNQISLFEAKVACGNGEQTLSRDIYRLGHGFDFFRMLSCYYTTTGFYVNSQLVVLTVYAYLYGRLYLSLSGLERAIMESARINGDSALTSTMASQSLVQLGLVMAFPMLIMTVVEKGLGTSLGNYALMQLRLASVFFTFSLGTKAHGFGRTILHGGAKYRATGRGFVLRHERFAENYRMYSRSHFTKAMEVLVLLLIYQVYGSTETRGIAYLILTGSLWFLVVCWLFAPFLYNPSGLEWNKIVEDWDDWSTWMSSSSNRLRGANKSWDSWWDEEQEHLQYTGLLGRLTEILLSLRFFFYQYGVVYHLKVSQSSEKSIMVYITSWLVIVTVIGILKIVDMGRNKFSIHFHLMYRLLKLLLFLLSGLMIVILFVCAGLTVGDVFASLLAFMPTGWAILQIGQACRKGVKALGLWGPLKALGRAYDYIMGVIIFTPLAIVSWFPMAHIFQTRILFNQPFSQGLLTRKWHRTS